jgi:hypothetical protein
MANGRGTLGVDGAAGSLRVWSVPGHGRGWWLLLVGAGALGWARGGRSAAVASGQGRSVPGPGAGGTARGDERDAKSQPVSALRLYKRRLLLLFPGKAYRGEPVR